MSRHKLADVQTCIHNTGKTGAKVGCANLPVYGCAVHGKCIHTRSCKTGSLKVCIECNEFSNTHPPEPNTTPAP